MSALARKPRSTIVAGEGQYCLTQAHFDEIAAVLHRETGIYLPPGKVQLVYSRLAKRIRKLGLGSFDEYCALVDSDHGADELREMLASLTTNHTSFFREPHHFVHLKEKVVPRLVESARRGESVRLWSSACSSGEEPYSIAFTLLEAFPDCHQHDVRILATDIDPHILNRARAGIYPSRCVETVPNLARKKWLAKGDEPDTWRVRDEVRKLISFKQLNLIREWPMKKQFDVIFCRNVVIYFQEETQVEIWQRFHDILKPTGRTYIGHSERIESDNFVTDGLTVYRRRDGS